MQMRRLFAYRIHDMRTVVYVDGFNLYYRALRKSRHKWLNLQALCEAALSRTCNIVAINYYTARVAIRLNSTSQKDQNTYLNALQTLPNMHIYLGNFQAKKKWMFMVQPVEFRPTHQTAPSPNPEFSRVIKIEEKGSDVNLAAHLVRDAFTNVFEHAVIITNDTDLKEPVRIISQEAMLPITLLAPSDNPAAELKQRATHVRHLRPYLGVSQFPDPVMGPKGPIAKPAGW